MRITRSPRFALRASTSVARCALVFIAAVLGATLVVVEVTPTAASAAWLASTSAASGSVRTRSLPVGPTPSATNVAYGVAVTITWAAGVYPDGSPVGGYVVTSSDAATGAPRAVGAGCAGTLGGLACTEVAAPDGSWRYTVTAAHGAKWLGTESAASAAVNVDATPPSGVALGSLPAAIRNGQVLSGSGVDASSGVASVAYRYCVGGACAPMTLIGTGRSTGQRAPTEPLLLLTNGRT